MKSAVIIAALVAVSDAIPQPTQLLAGRQTPPESVTGFLKDGPRAMVGAKSDPEGAIDIHDTFLFRNPSYFALQRYVIDGLKMPNKEEFRGKYNGTYLKPFMDNINAMIYPNSENAFNNVLEHCTSFHQTTLGDMTKFASNVKHWASDFANYYKSMSQVLKEREVKKTDEQLPKLRTYLKFISNQAVKAKAQCDSIEGALKKFEEDTIKDQASLDQLAQDLAAADPKSAAVAADYKAKLDAMWEKLHNAESQITYKTWQLNVQGPSYAWVIPWGLVTYLALMPGFKKDIADATLARDEATRDIARFGRELQGLNAVLSSIHDLQFQMKGVTENAKEALGQITKAKDSFQHMESDINSLKQHYDNADGLTTDDYWLSSTFADEIIFASQDWANVSTLAQEFDGKASINIVDLSTAENMAQKAAADQKPLGARWTWF